MFKRVLIANRGAVARRIARAATQLGVETVAVYSNSDAQAPLLEEVTHAVALNGDQPLQSYLDQTQLLQIARRAGVDAVHPGYGFLSESAGFARAVIDAGMTFIGPSPELIAQMGHKTRAQAQMKQLGVAVRAASAVLVDVEDALKAADLLGYPLLLKPAAGGGGIGMIPVADGTELREQFMAAGALAAANFGSAELYLEPLVKQPRHIELQMLADSSGEVMHLWERDCSIQRRHQKVLEEGPAPHLLRKEIAQLGTDMEQALQGLGYENLGTAEFLRDAQGHYGFLELNTRLQVEHAVTEELLGVDLVSLQIQLSAGGLLKTLLPQRPEPEGVAIEARIYAEDPVNLRPSPGRLDEFQYPQLRDVRVETGYTRGQLVPRYYDPLLAKVIVKAATRPKAIGRLLVALTAFEIRGVQHNVPLLKKLLGHPEFLRGGLDTSGLQLIQGADNSNGQAG